MTLFREITLINYGRPLAERKAARRYVGPYRWRPAAPGTGCGFYSSSRDMLQVDARGSSFQLRLEDANDHLRDSRLRFVTGYHGDSYGDFVLHPIIARLPRRRGFLAGYSAGPGMCAALSATIHETARDAALAAHDEAERWAERNREIEFEEDDETAAA